MNIFVKRTLAVAVDVVLVEMVVLLIARAFTDRLGVAAIFYVGFLLYRVSLEALLGATIGKKILRLQIQGLNSTRISWRQSFIRSIFFLIMAVSILSLLLAQRIWGADLASPGIMWVLILIDVVPFFSFHRGFMLHDRLSKTIVMARS